MNETNEYLRALRNTRAQTLAFLEEQRRAGASVVRIEVMEAELTIEMRADRELAVDK